MEFQQRRELQVESRFQNRDKISNMRLFDGITRHNSIHAGHDRFTPVESGRSRRKRLQKRTAALPVGEILRFQSGQKRMCGKCRKDISGATRVQSEVQQLFSGLLEDDNPAAPVQETADVEFFCQFPETEVQSGTSDQNCIDRIKRFELLEQGCGIGVTTFQKHVQRMLRIENGNGAFQRLRFPFRKNRKTGLLFGRASRHGSHSDPESAPGTLFHFRQRQPEDELLAETGNRVDRKRISPPYGAVVTGQRDVEIEFAPDSRFVYDEHCPLDGSAAVFIMRHRGRSIRRSHQVECVAAESMQHRFSERGQSGRRMLMTPEVVDADESRNVVGEFIGRIDHFSGLITAIGISVHHVTERSVMTHRARLSDERTDMGRAYRAFVCRQVIGRGAEVQSGNLPYCIRSI